MAGEGLGVAGSGLAKGDFLHFAAVDVVGETVATEAEVVFYFGDVIDFLQRRHLLIAVGAADANDRQFVGVYRNLNSRRDFVLAAGRIRELEFQDWVWVSANGGNSANG